MFSYYGTKKKLAGLYSEPKYNTIIEPFAGAAAYSLYGERWQNNVELYDTFPAIVAVWRYLIAASPDDILNLPAALKRGDKIDSFTQLSEAEKMLIGFSINPGSSMPKKTVTERGAKAWARSRLYIAENVHKVGHWKVFLKSYDQIFTDRLATWHIDPPYQMAGKYYFGHRHLDFKKIGEWVLGLRGQIMVCENEGADWLPFSFLTEHRGSIRKNVEVVYYREAQ